MVKNSALSYSCADAESNYIRSPFQGSSSAVTLYIISCKTLRSKVKHCPHGLLNQLLHKMQFLSLLDWITEVIHTYLLPPSTRPVVLPSWSTGQLDRLNIIYSSYSSLGLPPMWSVDCSLTRLICEAVQLQSVFNIQNYQLSAKLTASFLNTRYHENVPLITIFPILWRLHC